MLVLARKVNQSIVIGDQIKVTIVEVTKGKVKIGVDAPSHVSVHRQEVYEEIQRENLMARKVPLAKLHAVSRILRSGKKREP